METRKPLIVDIKHNSLDDGPGIRSVVFFKGCPLSCVWCHNPECIDAGLEIMFRFDKCIGCNSCKIACAQGAIGAAGPGNINKEKCNFCGACENECPSGAISIVGKYYTPDELVEELARDKTFYDNSGGGVTLSGGDPTLFMDYTSEVARKLKEMGIHICIETSGDFDWDRFERNLLPYVSLIYVDVKLVDENLHRQFTGRDNRRIKQNIEKLLALKSPEVLLRVPLIPDVNATEESLTSIAQWLRKHNVHRVALLPYNPLWINKAVGLKKQLKYDRESWMTQAEREKVKKIFAGFEITRDI